MAMDAPDAPRIAANRLASSAVFHPFEVIYQTLFGVGIGVFVLGIDPVAGAVLGYIGALLGMFQHLNVRTPSGSGTSFNAPKRTAFTISSTCTPTTTETSRCGTGSSGPSATPRPSRGASGSPRRLLSLRCSSGETSAAGSVTEWINDGRERWKQRGDGMSTNHGSDLTASSVVELAATLRSKKASAREVLGEHLARIERFNPAINAIVRLDQERARARAEQADAALARGESSGGRCTGCPSR